MDNTLTNPDKEFENIVKDHDIEKAITFFREESKAFINLKRLLYTITSKDAFDQNLDKMVEYSKFIRTIKLDLLNNHFKFYELCKKCYYHQLRKIIDR